LSVYFAYGSNMASSVIATACPRHRYLGRGRLPGFTLAFTRRSVRTGTGVVDAVVDPGGEVWGALYELADSDLEALDRKEGSGWAYARRLVRVFADDGRARDAAAYFVISKAVAPIQPSPEYARRLVEAGQERALPAAYLEELQRLIS
jgi:gamma-glutamylcyclotransferase (GGCT)/AIG2-like uncharacterized protein YtfP